MADRMPPSPPRFADNSGRWPSLATGLASAANCDCQVLAIAIADAIRPDPLPGQPAPTMKPRN